MLIINLYQQNLEISFGVKFTLNRFTQIIYFQ